MKILVTGATGFIGRAFCRVALERGHRVLALCRGTAAALPPEVEIAQGTLVDTPWKQVETFAPDATLHLAWLATPGSYLMSPENAVWLDQSITWFQRLQSMKPHHVAGAGTCFEYAASALPLQESLSPLAPLFPYSQAKVSLFQWLRKEGGFSAMPWTWFRVFIPYGPGEHPNRLTSSLITQLRAGNRLSLRTPYSLRDYIYIDDAALALCRALEEKITGAVNVGTGRGVVIQHLAQRIADALGVAPCQALPTGEPALDPTPSIVADLTRLGSIWTPKVSLEEGLQRLIDSLPMAT
ncbi:MAG: NAD(P)-dependent oxidoreductase [Prosthecobacter sp.]|uniref:NAD-dependent epimerase/dehydratase family protein n=1 Tax=Prosthecobacter sp. TaxID=1965333 RepID=UPI003BB1F43C